VRRKRSGHRFLEEKVTVRTGGDTISSEWLKADRGGHVPRPRRGLKKGGAGCKITRWENTLDNDAPWRKKTIPLPSPGEKLLSGSRILRSEEEGG